MHGKSRVAREPLLQRDVARRIVPKGLFLSNFPFFTETNPDRIMRAFRGGIAQLGERLHGMQEVSGSIPLTSTTKLQLQ
jgi:hypothetical protein